MYREAGPRSLRIAQVILSNKFAGTEQHVALLSCELVGRGMHVRLMYGDGNTRLIDEVRGSGVQVSAVQLGRGNLPLDWAAAYRAVAQFRPHIIHAHLGNSLLFGALVAPITHPHARLFFTQHFIKSAYLDASGPMAGLRSLSHRLVHRQVTYALATTRVARTTMAEREGFDADRIMVVPLGIDIDDIVRRSSIGSDSLRADLELPGDATIILTPARLEAEKGHTTLLAALPEVVAHHPNVQLVLAGAGALLDALKGQVSQLGMEDHVHFLGYRTDIPSLLRHATLCVLPAYEEPFGLVLLEAMAVGTPVIACDAGGPRDIVLHGETGLLVTPGDARSLSNAIVALLDDQSRAHAMGEAAKQRVRTHFSAAHMTDRIIELYREQACCTEGLQRDLSS